MNKKTTVVFDMDGTLLDTLDDLAGSANYAMQEMGFPLRSREEVQSFVGNGILVLIRKCVPEGTDEESIEKALTIFKKHYSLHCNDLTRTYEGIDELIESLQEKNIKMAIVSNKADFAVKELSEIYFKGKIPVAIGENESGGIRKKPAPDTVFKAMELLGSSPEESVYVGDSEVDVKTAANSGLDVILCAWGFREEAFLRSLGSYHIIHKPMELTDLIL
ncbi:MAG: HAD-IA family hydrolase [Eubacterium sp.]|nr:HAD-IA family hydrolase [Eubacterium sp.]